MIRAIKFICAIGCFTSVLVAAFFALLLLGRFYDSEKLLVLGLAIFLAGVAACLTWAGWHLIERQDLSMSRKAKIYISLLVVCCIGVTVPIVVPIFVKAHAPLLDSGTACINNLRQIDAAANQFALEHHLTNGAPINFPNDLTRLTSNSTAREAFLRVGQAAFITSAKSERNRLAL